jgi:hypothetical protein
MRYEADHSFPHELASAHQGRLQAKTCDRWCHLGGSSKQESQQQQTQTNTVDPAEWAMFQGNYNSAQDKANSLQPYTGQITAGFTPAQLQTQGILSSIATDPSYNAANENALNSITGVLGSGANITPGQLSSTDLSPYMNPYQRDVVDATMAQIGQQRNRQAVTDNQAATAAGAFGGSRQGVQRAVTNQLYDQDTASTLAGLNSANFSQAQGAAATDIGNRLTADQASFNNRLNAANTATQLNNNALNTALIQGGVLGQVGDVQQGQNQTELSNAYNAYLQGQQLTLAQQQLLNSALGLVPVQQTVSGTSNGTTTTTSNPGFGSILGGIGSLAMGFGKAGLGLSLSDGRLKRDVRTLGHDKKGRRWVAYRFKWEPADAPMRKGVIAQEIAQSDPQAVKVGPKGVLMVDYGKLREAA